MQRVRKAHFSGSRNENGARGRRLPPLPLPC
jgi:hypothetical protein